MRIAWRSTYNPILPKPIATSCVAVQKLGRWEESIVALKRALELQPHLAVCPLQLGSRVGQARPRRGRPRRLRNGHCLSSELCGRLSQRRGLLLATGNLVKAADYLERAIHLQPDFIDALVDLGNAYVRLGRKADARKTFRIVLHLNPNHSIALYNLGATLLEDGQTSEAREMLLRADAIEPGCADVELMRAAQYECSW